MYGFIWELASRTTLFSKPIPPVRKNRNSSTSNSFFELKCIYKAKSKKVMFISLSHNCMCSYVFDYLFLANLSRFSVVYYFTLILQTLN